MKCRGFTLVELMIALVIMGVMAVLMASSLNLTSKAWNRIGDRQDGSEHQYLVNQQIRNHLSSARFFRLRNSTGERIVSFTGSEQKLSFVAPFPGYNSDGTLYWWTLELRLNEEQQRELVMSYETFNDDAVIELDGEGGITQVVDFENENFDEFYGDPDSGEKNELIIATDVEEISFQYLQKDENDHLDWVSDWEPGYLLPQLVEVGVLYQTPGPSGEKLSSLVAAFRFARQRLIAGDNE
ncbi:type II secretion system protein [Porticoccaceae bacterium LTM1]|nr:type II secretion system protein [Porticoccaceae bacterium LTM1]